MACYLGKAKNPNAASFGMLDLFTHKFCGRAIIFGYDNATSHGSTGVLKATESGIDNYMIRLGDNAPPPAVPEPSTAILSLGLLSFAGLNSVRRRFQQRK